MCSSDLTVGTPILNIPIQVGINSNPSTYKQMMWIRQNNYSGMGTDAWVFNYGVSIGNTYSVQLGSRLTVGAGFTVYDTYVDTQSERTINLNVAGVGTIPTLLGTNLNYSGIGSIVTLSGTTLTYPTANINVGLVTNITGTNIYYSGLGTITTLAGTTLTYPTANITVGLVTNITGTNLSYSGIGTIANLTGSNISYSGFGTVATLSGTTLTYPTANINVGLVTNITGTNI